MYWSIFHRLSYSDKDIAPHTATVPLENLNMLKNPLLSGWFLTQPFPKYFVIAILVSPIVMIFIQSTLAEQSKAVRNTSEMAESHGISQESAVVKQPELRSGQVNSDDSQLGTENSPSSNSHSNTAVINPALNIADRQANLAEKISAPEIQSLPSQVNSQFRESPHPTVLQTPGSPTPIEAKAPSTPSMTEIPVEGMANESQELPEDPIGSPHPIPWNWMISTQESLGKRGASAVRQYRSLPVVSPDGKYSVYSRVQMEVKPEMYNSRVTSVLFIEDKQTGRLKVLTATSTLHDPLLNRQPAVPEQPHTSGTIEVLVPVSWSEKSDRFLARKFVGLFNTADVTDYAVIWDQQQNRINTVTPSYGENEHEKIAVLLGWSKKQPSNVLFRTGELGEENWPLLEVTSNGKTITTAIDRDQPVTYGERNAQIWAKPQVAYR
jgi:hypothetical protein